MGFCGFLGVGPSGTVQRFRLLLDSTGGGGYGLADSAGVSLSTTENRKKDPSPLKKSRKNKKGTTNPKKSPKIKKRIYAVIQKEFTVLTSCRNYGNMLS